jgi:hypothetical protein
MTRLRLGACLSLTGRYGGFGRQAANGLTAWQRLAGGDVVVEIEDDESDPGAFAARFARVASRCDVLLGPYSTQLMRAAAEALDEFDGLLWNQGGAGDDVQALRPGRIVSVLAPTSRYAEPFVKRRAVDADRGPFWVARGRGRFGRQVADSAAGRAAAAGLEVTRRRVGDGPLFETVPEFWDLLSCGPFEQDVMIVEEARATRHPPRSICSIAAGVRAFASTMNGVDGIYGVAQWCPGRGGRPDLGPAEAEFVRAYRDWVGEQPDYPAVQAAATAAIATHCAQLAGSLGTDALWAVAAELETTTLLGEFGIDAKSGAQTAHTPVLVLWRGDELELAP